MSWIGIVLVATFSANALLTYGLGGCDVLRRPGRRMPLRLLATLFSNFLATALLWSMDRLILGPLGLERFSVVAYALVIAPLIGLLARLALPRQDGTDRPLAAAIDESSLSCLVFGVALIVARQDFTIAEALLASVASILGFSASVVVLASIRRRMELSGMPQAFRNGPALLLSAGLMAMAFAGIDSYLISNLIG